MNYFVYEVCNMTPIQIAKQMPRRRGEMPISGREGN